MAEEMRPTPSAAGHPSANGPGTLPPPPVGPERGSVGLFEQFGPDMPDLDAPTMRAEAGPPPPPPPRDMRTSPAGDVSPDVEEHPATPVPGLPQPYDGRSYGAAATSAPRGRTFGGRVAAVLAGMVLGGVLGGIYSASTAGGAEASALVEIYATDTATLPSRNTGGSGSAADEIANFAANEFVALSGEAFKESVATAVGDPKAPAITVTRVGQSTVASFSAKGDTDEAGLRVVRTAVDLYTQRRARDLEDYARRTVGGIDRTVADLQAATPPRSQGVEVQQRVDRLLAQRADLELLLNSDVSPAKVVGPPSSVAPSGTPWLLGGALGALVGGLAAVGALTFRRSKTSLILDTAAAESVVAPILHPVVALPADWQQRTLSVGSARDRYAARLLAGQVAGSRPLVGRAVGVVGASAQSGARAVATLLAVGAAELTETELVEFTALPHPLLPTDADFDHGVRAEPTVREGLTLTQSDQPPTALRPGDPQWVHIHEVLRRRDRFVVIDAGTRPELLRQLPGDIEMLLVVGLGADDARHVSALARSLPSEAGPFGVVTRLPWFLRMPAVSRLRSDA